MTDKKNKTTDDAKETKATPSTEPAATAKKAVRRRPVWVCVPTAYEEVAVTDPDSGALTSVKQPTRYAITECPGGDGQKKAILAALAKHEIDPLNYGDVLMFRANPLPFKISNQLIIRV